MRPLYIRPARAPHAPAGPLCRPGRASRTLPGSGLAPLQPPGPVPPHRSRPPRVLPDSTTRGMRSRGGRPHSTARVKSPLPPRPPLTPGRRSAPRAPRSPRRRPGLASRPSRSPRGRGAGGSGALSGGAVRGATRSPGGYRLGAGGASGALGWLPYLPTPPTNSLCHLQLQRVREIRPDLGRISLLTGVVWGHAW
jgi:hypothetical protein